MGSLEHWLGMAQKVTWALVALGALVGNMVWWVRRPLEERMAHEAKTRAAADSAYVDRLSHELAGVNNKLIVVVRALEAEPGSREYERAIGALNEGLIGPRMER
jgi:ABC-type proline/glycine betaine transport system ATPase subunit